MRINTMLLVILMGNFCCGQPQKCCDEFPAFRNYIYAIVEDSTNYWADYPKPPKITDSVLLALQNEIAADDSAKYFLEQLSIKKFQGAVDYENAFRYIHKMDYDYSLLALTAHWNPDIRVKALRLLNNNLTIRPLVNSVKMKNGEWNKYDNIAIEFLVHLLESNPLFISGSENATIHGFYISNILWNLDLLTGENIVGKNNFSEWYKNDVQFETALLKWKAHLK